MVAPEHRRRGLGRRALALLVEHARRAGVRRLRCEVLAGNPAARLYRELGFRETGCLDDGGRVFVQLTAELSPEG